MTDVSLDLLYFGEGALSLTYDMGEILKLNPSFIPGLAAYLSLTLMVLVPFFTVLSLIKRNSIKPFKPAPNIS